MQIHTGERQRKELITGGTHMGHMFWDVLDFQPIVQSPETLYQDRRPPLDSAGVREDLTSSWPVPQIGDPLPRTNPHGTDGRHAPPRQQYEQPEFSGSIKP